MLFSFPCMNILFLLLLLHLFQKSCPYFITTLHQHLCKSISIQKLTANTKWWMGDENWFFHLPIKKVFLFSLGWIVTLVSLRHKMNRSTNMASLPLPPHTHQSPRTFRMNKQRPLMFAEPCSVKMVYWAMVYSLWVCSMAAHAECRQFYCMLLLLLSNQPTCSFNRKQGFLPATTRW